MEQLLTTAVSYADNSFALFTFLFLASFVNFFFPLVPIELVTVFCGYLVSRGHSSLPVVISSTTLGMFFGSVLFYRVAKYYGVPVLKKPFVARFIDTAALDRTRGWLEKYGTVSLFFSKFVPGVYLCAVVSSGILALKESRIYTAFFLSNLAVFSLLAGVGKIAGERWREVYAVLGKTGATVLFVALVAAMAIVLAVKLSRKIRKKV